MAETWADGISGRTQAGAATAAWLAGVAAALAAAVGGGTTVGSAAVGSAAVGAATGGPTTDGSAAAEPAAGSGRGALVAVVSGAVIVLFSLPGGGTKTRALLPRVLACSLVTLDASERPSRFCQSTPMRKCWQDGNEASAAPKAATGSRCTKRVHAAHAHEPHAYPSISLCKLHMQVALAGVLDFLDGNLVPLRGLADHLEHLAVLSLSDAALERILSEQTGEAAERIP